MKRIYFGVLLSITAIINCQTAINDPCPDTPAAGSSGNQSTVNSLSHNAGQNCLSCHDGTTSKSFDVAGTMVSGFFSSEVAGPGSTVSNVGGKTLTVDQCGNFYDVPNPVTTTQPSTANSSMNRPIPDGNCNNDGCHDGSTQSFIY